MVRTEGWEAREVWSIFKLFRRARRAVAACPEGAFVALRGIAKTLDRATSLIVAPFLILNRHKRTLAGDVCGVMT